MLLNWDPKKLDLTTGLPENFKKILYVFRKREMETLDSLESWLLSKARTNLSKMDLILSIYKAMNSSYY